MPIEFLRVVFASALGIFILVGTLWEGFETVVLPRSVNRPLRFTRLYYTFMWKVSSKIARKLNTNGQRALFLSYFGPVSLPILLSIWAIALIFGFALLQWAEGPESFKRIGPSGGFGESLYASGVTFFTLGYGDITPQTGLARFVSVAEAGVGFGFLALVIGYLPVLYQAFSSREGAISRLDGRGSSPATAGEILRRYGKARALSDLTEWLVDWEVWSSEILESHLSYPVLTFYRSQHDHQSWLGALCVILDICALILAGTDETLALDFRTRWQAKLTFAMARHTVIDLAYIFNAAPIAPEPDRLDDEKMLRLRQSLFEANIILPIESVYDERLAKLRMLYEPYLNALGSYLMYDLPDWIKAHESIDNWQTSAWEHGMRNSEGAHFQ